MIDRLLQWPAKRPGGALLLLGVLSFTAYTGSLVAFPKADGRIVIGDAVHYYVYLRSAVFDHDLKFENDYIGVYGLKGGEPGTEWVYEPTATGHTRNMMSVGPPIIWAPLFLITWGVTAAAHAFGAGSAVDGYGRVLQASAGWSGVTAATIGAWLAYRLANRWFSAHAAIWAAIVQWIGSNAVYYSTMSPTYSHAASMLVVSAFLLYWAASLERQTMWRYAVVGALGGFVALVRWQDAVFMIVPLTEVVTRTVSAGTEPVGARLRRGVLLLGTSCMAAVVAFLPQLLVWHVLYGTWVTMPQGSDWMQWTTPHVGKVLFSSWHGLFTWTPVTLLGVIGLFAMLPRYRLAAAAMLAALGVSIYANAAVLEWWAGEAFGHRRFVSCFPLFVVGTAALFERWSSRPRVVATIALVLILLNGLLLLQYQLYMHGARTIASYPKTWHSLLVERFVVPVRLIERGLR